MMSKLPYTMLAGCWADHGAHCLTDSTVSSASVWDQAPVVVWRANSTAQIVGRGMQTQRPCRMPPVILHIRTTKQVR